MRFVAAAAAVSVHLSDVETARSVEVGIRIQEASERAREKKEKKKKKNCSSIAINQEFVAIPMSHECSHLLAQPVSREISIRHGPHVYTFGSKYLQCVSVIRSMNARTFRPEYGQF